MNATRFSTADEFLAWAEDFLLRHEAHNNLLLGISSTVKINPKLYGNQLYFVIVEEAGQVVAAALMTPPHQLALGHTESPASLALIAEDVFKFRPDLPGAVGPATPVLWFAEAWKEHTGQPFRKSLAERIYKLEKVKPPLNVSGTMRRVVKSDGALLKKWLPAYQLEALGEPANEEAIERGLNSLFSMPPEVRGMFIWEDEQPVSLVGYGGLTRNGIRVGPVYTPKPFRGRGYASACTAAVSQYLLDGGRTFVFLFTDLSNPTSNKIYQQIGYEPVCDVDEYKFG
jgi:uncharacterized protein